MNPLFQNALRKIPQPVPPIWMMRQAGRYHGHYQKLKEKYDFMQLCKSAELAAEVALGPVEDFDFDVAILFSDLLFPLEALGFGLAYDPGPKLNRVLDAAFVSKLNQDKEVIEEAANFLGFQREAVKLTREGLSQDKSLIGFVGGPWTLFSYAIGAGHDGGLIAAKSNLNLYNDFARVLVPLLKRNIALQLEGGAEAVMVFDTAAGELSPAVFQKFIEPHLKSLSAEFPKRLGYYSKGTMMAHLHSLLDDANWAGHGFDHRWNLAEVLRRDTRGFVQGNFDQALLFSESSNFEQRLLEWLSPLSDLPPESRAGWVCGLGHGVLPKTPEDNVHRFVEIVRREFIK